ncbi:MAG: MFS transporter [Methanoregulaceae archaeon]|jgi:DHA2 family metal-tetracycline-proton antiporter-like MFS transporter
MPPGLESSVRDNRTILAIIAFAVFMASLDSTIVNISLPTIAEYFDIDIGVVSWVIMAYLLILAGCLLLFGKLGDMKGFRRVFVAGFVVFTLGSLLCGLSMSIEHLIAFRVFQGIGAAALEALAPAMIIVYLPSEKRGRALGVLATIVSLGIAAGPILGGIITKYLSWHWIFFINVPVGIVAVFFATRFLPVDKPSQKTEHFDAIGAVLFLLALVTLLFPLNKGIDYGWTSPIILGSFAASAVFWILGIFHERRCTSPLIDMRLFTIRNFVLGSMAGGIFMLVFNGGEFLLPFFFERVQGISTEIAGLYLAIPAIALMVIGPISGALSDRIGSRILTTSAAVLAAVALYLLSLFSQTSSLAFIVGALALLGVAMGLFFPPNMSAILGSCEKEGEGGVSSVMMTIRNTGSVVGVAIFGTVAVQVILSKAARLHTINYTPEILTAGFHAAFLFGIIFCIVAMVISAIIKDVKCA